ncbi:hypothetical protein DUI87_20633 [Hirundo rustica rustica]|uniref:diphosphoinositol-polyphosphate diphosphatase n=1 Tax=Hirundo rustica rustica TaxID=333673 RepID=A0A3M0JR19_HIRRU|nr:hypothetical protein DUI87_20633 [Hirundo rustica rustica]
MMKFKPNQTRTYDREGYKKRAACLCFRSEREDEVLLVSSSRYPDQWIVPGGGMEPEEEPGGAAVREVYEEAGVKGKLGRLLGVFEVMSAAIVANLLNEQMVIIFAFVMTASIGYLMCFTHRVELYSQHCVEDVAT